MKRTSKSVTMKDVAQAAKLSTAAVSLALRGHESIPPATRERVQQVADSLGYRKNPLLMALTTRRTTVAGPRRGRLAFLSNEVSEEVFLRQAHLRGFLEGARKQAKELGFELELVLADAGDALAVGRRLEELGCLGCIVGALQPAGPQPMVDWTRYAAVKIDSQHCEPEVCLVTNDNLHAVRLAYARLRELGYQRVGLATGSADELATSGQFLAGSLIEAAESGQEEPELPVLHFSPNSSFESQAQQLGSWVEAHGIEAVVSNWSGLPERLRLVGLRVPEDVAVAGLCLDVTEGELAGVKQQHALVGELAVDALVAKLDGRGSGADGGTRSIYVKGVWSYGRTAPFREVSHA